MIQETGSQKERTYCWYKEQPRVKERTYSW